MITTLYLGEMQTEDHLKAKLHGKKAFVIGVKGKTNSDLDMFQERFPFVKITRMQEGINWNYLRAVDREDHVLQPAFLEL